MGNLGFTELLIILLVVLLIFGAKRLPEIGASIGKGIREFKRSITDTSDAITSGMDTTTTQPPRQIDAASQPAPNAGEPKRLSQ